MKSYPYVLTRGSGLPVSLETVKKWLRMEGVVSEDDVITEAIEYATDMVEKRLNLLLAPCTLEWYTNLYPQVIRDTHLVTTLTSIEYFDGTSYQLLSSDLYDFVKTGEWSHVIHYADNLPELTERPDAVRVRFSAGYTATPASIKQAIRALLIEAFDNRGDYVAEKMTLSDKIIQNIAIPYAG